jgi:hypothetical protein
MKALLVMGIFLISASAYSAIIKSQDSKSSCALYRVIDNNADGSPPQLKAGESLAFSKRLYGMTLKNMDISFDNREVKVDLELSVILGANRNLMSKKLIIDEKNPNFKALINHLNRKVSEFQSVCISSGNEIVYARLRE